MDAFDGQARLELPKDGAGHDLEVLPGLVVLVDDLLGGHDRRVPLEARLLDDVVEPEALLREGRAHQADGAGELVEQRLLGSRRRVVGLVAVSVAGVSGEGRERLAEVLQDAAIVHDEPVVLALVHAVRPRDGLHQGVRLERLVEIERGQALHVEPGEPHRADDGDAERVPVLLEGALDVDPFSVGGLEALLDALAVGRDVEAPLPEPVDFALVLAHHHGDLGLPHPGKLPLQSFGFSAGRAGALVLQRLDAVLPVRLDQAVHPHGGDLVDGDEHRLAALPLRRTVRDEVLGDGVEPVRRGDDVVVALELAFEALFDVDVVGLELVELLGDPLVEIVGGEVELLAAGVVVERHGGAVFHGALEPVPGHVVAEHLPRDLVVLHQRGAGEGDIDGVGQRGALVEREAPVLRPVGFVDDHDDVVPVRVRLAGRDILVELLHEREDVGLVLAEQTFQAPAAVGPHVVVFADDAASGVRPIDLIVQVGAVAEHQEREVAAELAVHLAAEEHHGVGLPRPLRVPVDAEPAAPTVAVLDRADRPVHAEILLVLRDDLDRPVAAVVEEDEVLEEVDEVGLRADALEKRLHVDDAGLVLVEPLPLPEQLERGRPGAESGVDAVAEHDEGVVVEDVGDGVLVVGEVLVPGVADVAVDVLQLHEQQRNAVHEACEVGAAPVQRPLDPELAHDEKVVLLRLAEVEYAQRPGLLAAARFPVRHLHAVAQQVVLVAVGLQRRLRRVGVDDPADRFVVRPVRQRGIERFERRAEVADKHDLAFIGPPEESVRPESLREGTNRLPAEPLFEVVGGGLLDEVGFGIGRGTHAISPAFVTPIRIVPPVALAKAHISRPRLDVPERLNSVVKPSSRAMRAARALRFIPPTLRT